MDALINEVVKVIGPKLIELGVAGLLFIMWWFERRDRLTAEKREDVYLKIVQRAEEREQEVIGVIKENTEAITKLSGIINFESRRMQQHQRESRSERTT